MELVITKLYFLVPALLVLGALVKRSKRVPDWCIPFILLVFATVVSLMVLGWTLEGCIQGIFVTGVAVLGNQMFKQLIGKNTAGLSDIDVDAEIQGGVSVDNTEDE